MIFTAEEFIENTPFELEALLIEHKEELSSFPEEKLAPDWTKYAYLQGSGSLQYYTVRTPDTRKIVGYGVFFLQKHPHYNEMVCAEQDVFFLHSDYRGKTVGVRFLKWCEDQLKEHADVIIQHAKIGTDFDSLLSRTGYDLKERIYTKRIR